jgi:hypothetical protein
MLKLDTTRKIIGNEVLVHSGVAAVLAGHSVMGKFS